MTPLHSGLADHQALLKAVESAVGLMDPVAMELGQFQEPMLRKSRRLPVVPVEGVMIRDWHREMKQTNAGLSFGIRPYELEGITFCWVQCQCSIFPRQELYGFFAVSRKDYTKLYRAALRAKKVVAPPPKPPIMTAEAFSTLRRNTIDYLRPENLSRIEAYGARPKRGLLLSGPPGNGKTSACRWIRSECQLRGLEEKIVTPDDFRGARNCPNPVEAVKELFRVERPGVVFFDDLDMALRDRSTLDDPEDQAVFLGAMDGIESHAGIAYVFTTNLSLNLIDVAFRRPGRIDAMIHFPKPDAGLRRKLIERWHPEIFANLDLEKVVRHTEGLSFAEVEEFKNLMVLRFTETETWDWSWAAAQYQIQRHELSSPDE
jgi:cell division protease FtsH